MILSTAVFFFNHRIVYSAILKKLGHLIDGSSKLGKYDIVQRTPYGFLISIITFLRFQENRLMQFKNFDFFLCKSS